MKITTIKTNKVISTENSIYAVFNKYVKTVKVNSIVAITSKIISICEGRIVKIDGTDKDALIKKEAEYFLPRERNKQGVMLTIKNNLVIPTAGIDESNSNGYYVLWPKDAQKSANDIRAYLKSKFNKNIGVIITDSKSSLLRWGTTGVGLAHSGFDALNSYIDKPDIFGRKLKVTKANILDSLAAAAVTVMGEGNEQTPIAVIEDVPFVKFRDRNPTDAELKELYLPMQDDIFAPLLESVKWKRGEAGT